MDKSKHHKRTSSGDEYLSPQRQYTFQSILKYIKEQNETYCIKDDPLINFQQRVSKNLTPRDL